MDLTRPCLRRGAAIFIDPDKGANRSAPAVGANWLLNLKPVNKTEYCFDQASQPVFLDAATGGHRKRYPLLGASVVVSF